jgi:hypothetical protein
MFRLFLYFLVCVFLLSCTAQLQISQPTIHRLNFVGEFSLPHNLQFKGTTVGGLSSIDYSPEENTYYLICDDRSDINPVRFYTAKIKLSNSGITKVEIVNVTYLLQKDGKPYHSRKQNPHGVPDPEAMRYNQKTKQLVWSSEGERIIRKGDTVLTNPSIIQVQKDGTFIDTFPIQPNMHMKATQSGPRNNGVFEGLTFSPDHKSLYLSVEEPLYEDGHRAGISDSSGWVRIIKYDLESKQPVAQFAYQIDPVVQEPISQGLFIVNGVTDVLAINSHQLLVTERSFSTGRLGNNIRVYVAELNDAQDISRIGSLQTSPPQKPLLKRLLLDMDRLGRLIDNIEGATFGPKLPNGKQSLIFIADDNFSETQKSQFLLFEVE